MIRFTLFKFSKGTNISVLRPNGSTWENTKASKDIVFTDLQIRPIRFSADKIVFSQNKWLCAVSKSDVSNGMTI